MDFLFSVNNFDRGIVFKSNDDGDDTGASVLLDIPYQRITVNIFPLFWENKLKDQREMILHEYCHIIVHTLQRVTNDLSEGKFRTHKEIRDAVEECTSRFTMLLDAQLKGRNKYARVAYEKYLK